MAKSMFTIAGSALRAVLDTAFVSQTLTEWAKSLQQAYTYIGVYVDSQVPQAYVELVHQVGPGNTIHLGGIASASPVAKMLVY